MRNEFFPEGTRLQDVESFMMGVSHEIKKGWAHLAVSLATIKTEELYLPITGSWIEYIRMERTGLKYRQSLKLAKAGEIYLRYQGDLESENIKLSDNLTKLSMVDSEIVEFDPMYFVNFKSLSSRQLQDYQNEKRKLLRAYPVSSQKGEVSVKGSAIYIGDQKLKGLSLSEAREKMGQGKRLLALWVDDDEAAVRRVRRSLDRAGIED